MSYYSLCPICNKNMATQKHHLFSNTKLNRKLYGKLIEDPCNIVYLCEECHLWKGAPKQSEDEFCRKLKIKKRGKHGSNRG